MPIVNPKMTEYTATLSMPLSALFSVDIKCKTSSPAIYRFGGLFCV